MHYKTKHLVTLACLIFLFSSVSLVNGAVIEDIMVFGDFDIDGNPIEQYIFTSEDDIVGLWFNLSDVSPGDNIIIEWWPPSGELYKTTNWTAPFWIQEDSDWDMWEDMEIMGDPPENMPGVWAADITVDGAWWGHVPFEIVTDGASTNSTTGSGSDSGEVIRGYYVWVTDVRPVGEIILGQNVTIEVDIEYNFLEVPLVPTIMDHNYEIRGETSDTIQGNGEKTYTVTMETHETDDTSVFAVVAYYFIEGKWTYMDPDGYMPFTLGQGDNTSIPDGTELPDGFDFSDIDIEQITSKLNDTIQRGLDLLDDVEIPDELSGVEETIKEKTGIPGFPVEALVLGAVVLVYMTRRRH